MSLPDPQKGSPSKSLVPGRAVAIPRNYHATVKLSAGDGPTVPTTVQIDLTLRILKPGETAEDVIRSLPAEAGVVVPDPSAETLSGVQRVRFFVPDWVEVLIRQVGEGHRLFPELPVWIDVTSDRIDSVDVEKLIAELEPEREKDLRMSGDT